MIVIYDRKTFIEEATGASLCCGFDIQKIFCKDVQSEKIFCKHERYETVKSDTRLYHKTYYGRNHGFRNKLEYLSLNTKLGWKGLPGTNTLAYYGP
jgi:hypothetical protein